MDCCRDMPYFSLSFSSPIFFSRYHLKGPKAGQSEIFADNLPGLPDNIRLSTSGGYWVAMTMLRNRDKFGVVEFIQKRPWLRSFLARVGVLFI